LAGGPSSLAVTLAWTDNSTNETGFVIERAASISGPWTQAGSVPANTTNYADTTVSCGASYYYRVKAYNDAGSSDYSNVAGPAISSLSIAPTYNSVTAGGGSGTVSVNSGGPCSWTATANVGWLHTSSSGSGNGTVSYSVDANTTASARSGTISVGGQTFTVNQAAAPCTYTLSPSGTNSFPAAGGGANFAVTTLTGCAWTATANVGWLHTSSSGSGNGTVSYSVDANTTASTRSGTISVGGQTFVVNQAAADLTPPALTITTPSDYQNFTTAGILISGTTTDASGVAGVRVNGTPAALSGNNWSVSWTLTAGTNTLMVVATDKSLPPNATTQTVHAVLGSTPLSHCPVIEMLPSVTNALLQAHQVALVAGGEAVTFSVEASDPDGNVLAAQWAFGDGTTNELWSPNHTYPATNCAPYQVGVSISDGQCTVSTGMTVVVACELQVLSLQPQLNFARAQRDSCRLVALVDLGTGFSVNGRLVNVNIGGATAGFMLDSKGRGANGAGNCRLKYDKKSGVWKLVTRLAKGDWQGVWAAAGLVNADVAKPGSAVKLPLAVLIDTEGYASEPSLIYTAKAGKSGSAK
jgi:hypothetical protein